MKKSLLLATSLLVLIAATGSAFAQSTDRDHPTPFTSDEIKGELNGEEIEYFYSFTAGPGEVTITVDVKSSGGTTGTAFELLDADANKVLICCEGAQADSTGTTGRDVKSIKLGKRQTVILHLTPFKYGTGTYRVRISGAVAFAEHRQRDSHSRMTVFGQDQDGVLDIMVQSRRDKKAAKKFFRTLLKGLR